MDYKSLLIAAALALPAGPALAQIDTSLGSTFESVRQGQEEDQSKAKAKHDARVKAAADARIVDADLADIVAGAEVYDNDGGLIGTIESVDDRGVVLATARARARVPAASFGKNKKGLTIGMTKAEFEAAAGG